MNVAPPLESPLPPAPRRKSRRIILAVVSGLTLLAAVGAAVHFGTKGGGAAAETSVAAARQQARTALAAFLASPAPEGRAGLVIEGDKLLPTMQAWYAAHESEALDVDSFQEPGWTFSTPSADLIALECPRDRGRSPVVACFKKSDTGSWLLDWEVWTQSFDSQFRNFINRPAEGEQLLRASLTRGHSGTGMNVTVADPFDASQTMTFDISRPDLLALYNRDLPEAGRRMATIQLVWLNNPLTGTLSPALRRHVCWGFTGLDGREPEEVVINMRSKNRPPPGTPAVAPALLVSAPAIKAAVETAIGPANSSGNLFPPAVQPPGATKTAKQ